MTSISAASAQTYQSPLQKLQDELLSEVKSGAIKSSDQDALASALTDIDSAMQASRASDQASGTRPSPADLKSKIDDLIAGEVSSGKLTSDQATELQGIFKAAFANGPGGAAVPAARVAPAVPLRVVPAARRLRMMRPPATILRRHYFDFDRRHSEAVPAIAAGIAVGLVIDVLRRDRQFKHEQQRFLLRVADRLPELTPHRAFLKADKAPLATILSEREGWLSHFRLQEPGGDCHVGSDTDVWRVQWQATS